MAATRNEIARALLTRRASIPISARERDDVISPACFTDLLAIDLRDEPGESGERRADGYVLGSFGERARRDVLNVLRAHYPDRQFISPQIYHTYLTLVRGAQR